MVTNARPDRKQQSTRMMGSILLSAGLWRFSNTGRPRPLWVARPCGGAIRPLGAIEEHSDLDVCPRSTAGGTHAAAVQLGSNTVAAGNPGSLDFPHDRQHVGVTLRRGGLNGLPSENCGLDHPRISYRAS